MSALREMKQAARTTWASGDYDAFLRGERFYEFGERLVRTAGVTPGERVLDVACGTGNAAIPAAQAGGVVTGVDLTPELLDVARQRAGQAGVQVEWREGDAEELPLDDESVDLVLSSFGCMFAPRHEEVAGQIARVLRPGGRLAIYAWAPQGPLAEFFHLVGAYLPPPPEIAQPPLLWGDPEHVRALFDGDGVTFDFQLQRAHLSYASVEDAVHAYTTLFGPVVQARTLAQEAGRWPSLRDELASLFARHNAAADDGFALPADYLVILGRKKD